MSRRHAVKTARSSIATVDTHTTSPEPKRADPFYLAPQWRKLMAEIIRERGRICQDPNCDGKTHSPGMRVFGDHIVELRDGGAPYDKANVMLLCGAAHTRKTAEQRAKRLAQGS